MKRFGKMMMTLGAAALVGACSGKKAEEPFRYTVDSFADLKVMRYQIPGWDSLSLKQKEYAYHLAEAAKYGRPGHPLGPELPGQPPGPPRGGEHPGELPGRPQER